MVNGGDLTTPVHCAEQHWPHRTRQVLLWQSARLQTEHQHERHNLHQLGRSRHDQGRECLSLTFSYLQPLTANRYRSYRRTDSRHTISTRHNDRSTHLVKRTDLAPMDAHHFGSLCSFDSHQLCRPTKMDQRRKGQARRFPTIWHAHHRPCRHLHHHGYRRVRLCLYHRPQRQEGSQCY